MINFQSADQGSQPAPAPCGQPSDEQIVEGMARIIRQLQFAGHPVEIEAVFLKGEGEFTRAEARKHMEAACDRAIEVGREDAARRKAA